MSQPAAPPPEDLPVAPAPEVTSGPIAPPPTRSRPVRDDIYRENPILWLAHGVVRLSYRLWTRVASRFFPEGSTQARALERIGVPLPDRLDLSWIDATLAVGGRVRPADITRLSRVGVTRVVDVRSEHRDDESALNAAGIELLYLPTPDTYPLSLSDLQRGAEWINAQRQAGQRVLVHCEHGVGRSVLLAAAALVCEGSSAKEAFTAIEHKRWQAAPNRRQVYRLIEFERAGGCQGN